MTAPRRWWRQDQAGACRAERSCSSDAKIIGADPRVRWIDSPKFRFEYENGSILQFIGLSDENARENLKSIGQDGAVDIALMEEGSQFEEADLNAMIARMRGRPHPGGRSSPPTRRANALD